MQFENSSNEDIWNMTGGVDEGVLEFTGLGSLGCVDSSYRKGWESRFWMEEVGTGVRQVGESGGGKAVS